MYEDDKGISYSPRSFNASTNAIHSDLQNLSLWLQGDKLTLNVAKTHSMIFGTEPNIRRLDCDNSNNFPLFQINGETIESTDKIKNLGIKIDPTLNWKEQINEAILKISRGIGMLKYTKRYLPLHTIQCMHYCIVDPHLRYCCSVWGCAGDSIITKLQKLQNQAARVVTNSPIDQISFYILLHIFMFLSLLFSYIGILISF